MLHLSRLTVAILAIGVLLGGCGDRGGEAPAPKPPPVEVLSVREQPVIPRFEYVGRVEATDEFAVRPRVEGYIQARLFEEGSMVKAGELLYEIDPQPFVAALENRRAALANVRVALRVAERNYRRGTGLVGRGFISKVDMDELQKNFEQAQGSLDAAMADVEAAELNLSYTKIYAPFTGRIGRSSFPEGSLVGPASEPLATVLNMDPIFVLFEVPEDRALTVQMETERRRRTGQSPVQRDIRIELPDGSFYPHRGVIAFVDNQVNVNTGSLAVRARFPNPNQLLVQGQFARVSVKVFTGKESIKPLVPQSAVLEDMQGRYVFVVDDEDIARRRAVELGQREGELWAVEKGIKAGERVIVNGLQRVVVDRPVTPQGAPHNPYTGGEGFDGSPVPEQPANSEKGQSERERLMDSK